jgi:CubicO group peptidase (beta-lactamase class C family)
MTRFRSRSIRSSTGSRLLFLVVTGFLLAPPPSGFGLGPALPLLPDSIQAVDGIFRAFDSTRSPGCAVAVAAEGRTILARAYGMADLEHRIANEANTIFEAGSVSKQFTAAAVALLAAEGHLSLDDDIREYIPEVPDYGGIITIRHLFTHTSGLRDWGSVAAISGWGRPDRTHDHDHVLEIIQRQTALNYPPGEAYSYTNSGYNLLAILVERVSGQSLARFSADRLFRPLGLHDTQWRDDYRRIVPGRASAYGPEGDGFRIDRPIEHVHGNGGLLTTVHDLVRWNDHLRKGTLGAEVMEALHTRGVLNDGTRISYAGGLQFGDQAGHPRISHTGATSGYRAYLSLFPEQELSVAVLCNTSSANPGELGGQVSAVFLPESDRVADEAEEETEAGDDDEPPRWEPTVQELEALVGDYHSDEAPATLRVRLEEGRPVIHRVPASRFDLSPGHEPDTFESALGTIRFIRDGEGSGGPGELSLAQPRVHDMRFRRLEP